MTVIHSFMLNKDGTVEYVKKNPIIFFDLRVYLEPPLLMAVLVD